MTMFNKRGIKVNRIIQLFLAILAMVILILLAPRPAFAAEIVGSGECGSDGSAVAWTLYSDGVLELSGEGKMTDFESASTAPWYSERSNITKIVISDGIINIGDRAFYQCSNVTDVVIGESVETIGIWAFYNTSLSEVTVPASVNTLGDSSFRSCTSLSIFRFEGNAPELGNYVFTGVSDAIVIHCYENTTGWDVEKWIGFNIVTDHKFSEITVIKEPTCTESGEKQGICLICGETVTEIIPALGHEYIDGYCKICEEREILEKGVCGYGVEYVLYSDGELIIYGTGAMYNNWTQYDHVSSDVVSPWNDSKRIKTVVIDYGVSSIGRYAFYNCSLTSITIPDSVTSIGEYAFYSCSSLTSITIPESVTSIGKGAFNYCVNLISITIPESVTSIGYLVFEGCSSLKNVYINNIETWCNLFEYSYNPFFSSGGGSIYVEEIELKELTIPDSVTHIGYAFQCCSGITSIMIPESVTSIGSGAFSGCTSLESITIPESVTSIGNDAFFDCRSLASIMIPEGITSIELQTFDGCSSLTSITIPESVTSIGYEAFYGCSSLTSIKIPDSVTSIGKGTFYGCSSLTSIKIPDSVTSIGEWAFYKCSSITSITIPESMTSIGEYAFYNCSSLASIAIPESVTSIGNYAFSNCTSLASVYVVKDSYADKYFPNDSRKKYVYKSGEHYYYEEITKQPTTTEFGTKTITCVICGDTWTEEIPKLFYTGWQKLDGKWYYFDADGIMQTGWQKLSNKWYYFDASGVMKTGWVKLSNKWYYFNSSGVMQTGWQKIGSKQYYFKSSGAMAANEWVKGYYWINKDGTWTYKYKASWKKSGSKWWFTDTSGWYAKNTTIVIDGKKYTFDKSGWLV